MYVPKSEGGIRLCGDYKVTINPYIEVDPYPLPTAQDLFAAQAGGKVFTKLDMRQTYHQVELDDKSKDYLVINTHCGLYSYESLSNGVNTAPVLFQKMMDQILQGLEGVLCYLDDVLIVSSTEEDNLAMLAEVLRWFKKHGVRLKREKCSFLQRSVEYLGHKVDAEGIRPTAEKVKALTDARQPENVSELLSYLGLLRYYPKSLPELGTVLEPLNALTHQGTPWDWGEPQETSFTSSKQIILNAGVLVHYYVNLPITIFLSH